MFSVINSSVIQQYIKYMFVQCNCLFDIFDPLIDITLKECNNRLNHLYWHHRMPEITQE